MSERSHANGWGRKVSRPLWYLAVVLATWGWLAAAGAMEAQAAGPCADAVSTVEIRECLNRQYTKADAELNVVWKKVMAHVADADYLPAKERKVWKEELLEAQRAWITFKEHDCDAVGFEWFGGSGAGGAVLSCLIGHTTARTTSLSERYLDR